jgi:hypothetical protein
LEAASVARAQVERACPHTYRFRGFYCVRAGTAASQLIGIGAFKAGNRLVIRKCSENAAASAGHPRPCVALARWAWPSFSRCLQH